MYFKYITGLLCINDSQLPSILHFRPNVRYWIVSVHPLPMIPKSEDRLFVSRCQPRTWTVCTNRTYSSVWRTSTSSNTRKEKRMLSISMRKSCYKTKLTYASAMKRRRTYISSSQHRPVKASPRQRIHLTVSQLSLPVGPETNVTYRWACPRGYSESGYSDQ